MICNDWPFLSVSLHTFFSQEVQFFSTVFMNSVMFWRGVRCFILKSGVERMFSWFLTAGLQVWAFLGVGYAHVLKHRFSSLLRTCVPPQLCDHHPPQEWVCPLFSCTSAPFHLQMNSAAWCLFHFQHSGLFEDINISWCRWTELDFKKQEDKGESLWPHSAPTCLRCCPFSPPVFHSLTCK